MSAGSCRVSPTDPTDLRSPTDPTDNVGRVLPGEPTRPQKTQRTEGARQTQRTLSVGSYRASQSGVCWVDPTVCWVVCLLGVCWGLNTQQTVGFVGYPNRQCWGKWPPPLTARSPISQELPYL